MHRRTPLMCHCEERSDVAISGRQLRFRRGFPVIHPGTARLPRPRWGLAMTNPEALCRRITKNAPRMRRCPDQNVMGRCGRSAP